MAIGRLFVALCAVALLQACATRVAIDRCGSGAANQCLLEPKNPEAKALSPFEPADSTTELAAAWQSAWLATYGDEKWARPCTVDAVSCDRPRFGLALAGGGSKSAPFAMGVVKRLVEEQRISRIDILSSVSGGGYAAYYLYRNAHEVRDRTGAVPTSDLATRFRFGARLGTKTVLSEGKPTTLQVYRAEPKFNQDEPYESRKCESFTTDSRHQAWVACHQDVLSAGPGGVTWQMGSFPLPSIAGQAVLTALAAPLHHIANTVFDWGVNLTPSQHAYAGGLFRTYGVPVPRGPVDAWQENRPEEVIAQGTLGGLTFADLRTLQEGPSERRGMPTWVMQATVGQTSTWLDSDDEVLLPDNSIFELSATRFGSIRAGFVRGSAPDLVDPAMNVKKSVATSAAFFDPLQRTLGSRRAVTIALHTLNVRWGTRFPNFRPDAHSPELHRLLPFPLYLLASRSYDNNQEPYWNLADGGISGDNLGLFAHLLRGTRDIITVDGAQDFDGGNMLLPELCYIDKYLRERHGVRLEFTGDPVHDKEQDTAFILAEKCLATDKARSMGLAPGHRIEAVKWNRPVWSGTVRRSTRDAPLTRLGAMLSQPGKETRIHYIKSGIQLDPLDAAVKTYASHESKEPCVGLDTGTGAPCGLLYSVDGLVKAEIKGSWISKVASVFLGKALTARHVFPQNSTVLLTADSSAQSYLGYFWLGWHLAGGLCAENGGVLKKSSLCDAAPNLPR